MSYTTPTAPICLAIELRNVKANSTSILLTRFLIQSTKTTCIATKLEASRTNATMSLVRASSRPQSAAIFGMIACQIHTSTSTVIDVIMYTSCDIAKHIAYRYRPTTLLADVQHCGYHVVLIPQMPRDIRGNLSRLLEIRDNGKLLLNYINPLIHRW